MLFYAIQLLVQLMTVPLVSHRRAEPVKRAGPLPVLRNLRNAHLHRRRDRLFFIPDRSMALVSFEALSDHHAALRDRDAIRRVVVLAAMAREGPEWNASLLQ